MGCDIHCYIEYRIVGSEGWNSFGNRINPGRNYSLFSLMANVRETGDDILFKPKGLPDNIGTAAFGDNYIFIYDSDIKESGYVSVKQAEKWVKSGVSVYKYNHLGKPTWVSHPDWHSHSWLNLSEYRQVLEKYKVLEQKQFEELERGRLVLLEDFKVNGQGLEIGDGSWLSKPCEHNIEPEYQVLEVILSKFEEFGFESRLVFWFDN